MNTSLTILCAIAVIIAMAGAFLGKDDVENGSVLPWQFIGSFALGLLITHGEYYQAAYTWMHARLIGDGAAGMIVSAGFACVVEAFVASPPMLGGAALHLLLSAWDDRFPLKSNSGQSRRGRVVSFLRAFTLR